VRQALYRCTGPLSTRTGAALDAWAAHEGGTFLCWVDVKSIDGKGHTPADFVRFVEESFGGCEWYLWDGVSLQTCSAEGAADYARTFEWCAHV